MPRSGLYSTADAAMRLGMEASGIRRLATRYGIGRKVGERAWAFTAADLDKIQSHASGDGRRGRPRNAPSAPCSAPGRDKAAGPAPEGG